MSSTEIFSALHFPELHEVLQNTFLVLNIESFLPESSVNELDHSLTETEIYVVLPFYHWFRFSFLLFLCMVMYDNELETKEK